MAIELTRHEELAVITLNRPEALNALSFTLLRDLGQAIDEVAASDARALLFIGAGAKAFCAGADIKELTARSLVSQKAGAEFGQATMTKLDSLPIASVAIVNGYAFGGGLELAMACTFRVGTAQAKMGLPEIKLGLIPGYGGTQRLPRLIGVTRATELIMTGRTLSAAQALEWGLLNRLVEGDPLAAGVAFAREFTSYSLPVLGFARQAVSRALATSLAEGLKIEADLSTLAYRTADADEGMQAFLDKRPARFGDR